MPPLRAADYRTLAKVFERDGFTLNRQRGDHLIYTKTGVKRPLVIPMYKGSSRVHYQEPPPYRRNEPRTIFRSSEKLLSTYHPSKPGTETGSRREVPRFSEPTAARSQGCVTC